MDAIEDPILKRTIWETGSIAITDKEAAERERAAQEAATSIARAEKHIRDIERVEEARKKVAVKLVLLLSQ